MSALWCVERLVTMSSGKDLWPTSLPPLRGARPPAEHRGPWVPSRTPRGEQTSPPMSNSGTRARTGHTLSVGAGEVDLCRCPGHATVRAGIMACTHRVSPSLLVHNVGMLRVPRGDHRSRVGRPSRSSRPGRCPGRSGIISWVRREPAHRGRSSAPGHRRWPWREPRPSTGRGPSRGPTAAARLRRLPAGSRVDHEGGGFSGARREVDARSPDTPPAPPGRIDLRPLASATTAGSESPRRSGRGCRSRSSMAPGRSPLQPPCAGPVWGAFP